ncbi:MAG: hypothetical protein AAF288_09680 [Planctomycetota bacterium]
MNTPADNPGGHASRRNPAQREPGLRLVGRPEPRHADPAAVPSRPLTRRTVRRTPASEKDAGTSAALSPADPRWVLAQRAAESLEGTLITADRRERLLKLGRALGLTSFDASLVMAIVQDRARRGVPARLCPTSGLDQLAQVSPPEPARRKPRPLALTTLTVGLLLAQAGLIFLLLNR